MQLSFVINQVIQINASYYFFSLFNKNPILQPLQLGLFKDFALYQLSLGNCVNYILRISEILFDMSVKSDVRTINTECWITFLQYKSLFKCLKLILCIISLIQLDTETPFIF